MERVLADVILVVHFLFIAFVVLGQAAILIGWRAGWAWVRNRWYRFAHLAAIAIVALQAWLGVICPLTVWESQLREAAGGAGYSGTFVSHWISRLIYYDAPWWVFTLLYTAFGLLVLASWFLVRPGHPVAGREAGR